MFPLHHLHAVFVEARKGHQTPNPGCCDPWHLTQTCSFTMLKTWKQHWKGRDYLYFRRDIHHSLLVQWPEPAPKSHTGTGETPEESGNRRLMSNSKAYPRPQQAVPPRKEEEEVRQSEANRRYTKQKGFAKDLGCEVTLEKKSFPWAWMSWALPSYLLVLPWSNIWKSQATILRER